jgi:thiol-disulfide isomerase/thioredoxin
MQKTTRRGIVAGAGVLAVGTVAAAALLRKPAPQIATPVVAPGTGSVVLHDIAGMNIANPPAPPPPAGFTDAEGVAHTLADFAGKGLVVNLWATWCAPCVAEMPALQGLAEAVAKDGILVLPLSSDFGGAAAVRKFYAAHQITALKIWLDPKGAVGQAWGARGLPTTLIIDRHGREQGRLEGAVDWTRPATLAAIRRLVGPPAA